MSWKENKPIVILVTALLAVCFWMASCIVFTATAKADYVAAGITTGNDDAGTDNDSYSATAYSLPPGNYGGSGLLDEAYLRFALPIPAGATINACSIRVQAISTNSSTTCNLQGHCEAADDAATLATLGSRSWTTANVLFNNVPAWTANNVYYFAGWEDPLQEVIDRPGWVSGNNVVFRLSDNGSTVERYRSIASWNYYNDGGGTYPESIHVWYTVGGEEESTPTRRRRIIQFGSLEIREFPLWCRVEDVR